MKTNSKSPFAGLATCLCRPRSGHKWTASSPLHAEVDPASKLKGSISVIVGIQVSLRFTTVREMKYTLQHCCEKAKNGIIYVNNVFRIVQIIRQKHCWNYFAFNQSYLAKGNIAPVVLLPHEAK